MTGTLNYDRSGCPEPITVYSLQSKVYSLQSTDCSGQIQRNRARSAPAPHAPRAAPPRCIGTQRKESVKTMKLLHTHIRARDILCRAGLVLLMLAMLGGVLVSCGGKAATPTLTLNEEALVPSEENGNALDKDQLKMLAEKIKENSNAVVIRQQLVAALNGYDMTATGFDDANLPEAQPDKSVEFALNVLKYEPYKVEVFNFTDSMTQADLEMLVNSFRTTVDTTAHIDFLTRILMWIAVAFEWMINTLGFGSFLLGTVFFAIAVEIIMIPISIIQQNNARKQARFRPKEMAIRKKYAGRNDQKTLQDMNTEIQEMYQKEGYSQMSSGCLPLLVSLPIVFALYYVVIDPLKYMMGCPSGLADALRTFVETPRAAGGLGLTLESTNRGTIEILSYIRDIGVSGLEPLRNFRFFTNGDICFEELSNILTSHEIPNFSIGSLNFGMTPGLSNPWLLFIPVLTFGVYFGTSKLTRKLSYQPMTANDPGVGCSNTIMDVSMPLMSAVFTFWVPGAVGLYWAIKSVVGLGKQFIMSKVMPLPKFTDADYKAAERELAGKDKNRPVKKSGTRNPNVRSLHHIDDEDYETPAKPAGNRKAAPAQPETEPSGSEPAETLMGDGAVLKEDVPAEERRAKRKKSGKGKDDSEPAQDSDKID